MLEAIWPLDLLFYHENQRILAFDMLLTQFWGLFVYVFLWGLCELIAEIPTTTYLLTRILFFCWNRCKGAFTNYVDKFLAFFDHLPSCVDIFYLPHKRWQKVKSFGLLPTSYCQRSLRKPPNLVLVVREYCLTQHGIKSANWRQITKKNSHQLNVLRSDPTPFFRYKNWQLLANKLTT